MDLPLLLFNWGNALVMPFWLTMIFAPQWRGTQWLAQLMPGVMLVALGYSWLLVPSIAQTFPLVVNPKLDQLLLALSTPTGFTVLWLHVLALDLTAGTFIYRRARRRGQSAWLTGPILLLTLLMGPIGVLLHLVSEQFDGGIWGNRLAD